MRTAVVFTSKFGTTQRTAEYIAKALNADLFDLGKGAPAIAEHEMIVLGSGIYAGNMSKRMRTFVSDLGAMNDKRLALFVCCR
ncbi:MAG: hypothetical protein LBV13_03725, partial [Methanomassiliicoccaceae archaeon]|nr:hypothetical protein [Methanomassiliicoccaceae archaeon]